MAKKIIILGGGISGLSCAFDLIQKGFRVEVYERNSVCGGQSRSVKSGRCTVEYAWRIWSSYYRNWFDICKSIPISKTKTIADNMIECCQDYNSSSSNIRGTSLSDANSVLNIKKWKSKTEYYRLILKLTNMVLMSDDRLKHNDITFIDYIQPQ